MGESKDMYCICNDDGIKTHLKIIHFIEVNQYHPFTVRAVCLDEFGNISTPSIEQIKVIMNDKST